jgi:hypothetical protein
VSVIEKKNEFICKMAKLGGGRAKFKSASLHWRCGSSSRVPALQSQSPEFKPQSHQKTKQNKQGDLRRGEEQRRHHGLIFTTSCSTHVQEMAVLA